MFEPLKLQDAYVNIRSKFPQVEVLLFGPAFFSKAHQVGFEPESMCEESHSRASLGRHTACRKARVRPVFVLVREMCSLAVVLRPNLVTIAERTGAWICTDVAHLQIYDQMQVNLEQQEFGCFTGEKPMSGFYAVLYALAACTHVDLYGFDPWTDAMAHDPSRQFRYHYFDDDQPRTGAHSFDATFYMYTSVPPWPSAWPLPIDDVAQQWR
jgi:hypothetical protein